MEEPEKEALFDEGTANAASALPNATAATEEGRDTTAPGHVPPSNTTLVLAGPVPEITGATDSSPTLVTQALATPPRADALLKEWEDAANELQRANASVLEPWEQEFCERMALREKPLSATKQAKAASGLAGREVTVDEIKRLRDRRAYRTLKYSIRAHRQEVLDEARGIMLETLPEAARLGQRAVNELNAAPPGQLDVRAVPAIIQPYQDRTWPKKTEQETRTTIVTVNLTGNQLAQLDIPAIEVEAEEVEAEIIP